MIRPGKLLSGLFSAAIGKWVLYKERFVWFTMLEGQELQEHGSSF